MLSFRKRNRQVERGSNSRDSHQKRLTNTTGLMIRLGRFLSIHSDNQNCGGTQMRGTNMTRMALVQRYFTNLHVTAWFVYKLGLIVQMTWSSRCLQLCILGGSRSSTYWKSVPLLHCYPVEFRITILIANNGSYHRDFFKAKQPVFWSKEIYLFRPPGAAYNRCWSFDNKVPTCSVYNSFSRESNDFRYSRGLMIVNRIGLSQPLQVSFWGICVCMAGRYKMLDE